MTTLQQDDAAYAAKLDRAQQMLDQWELEDAAGSGAPLAEVIDLRDKDEVRS